MLYWIARGDATGHSARVEVSSDEGNNWLVLASNVPPGTSSVVWDTTLIPSSVLGLWRVVSEVNPAVVAQTEQTFAIRNGPILFYLNDGSTNGNVYTTAPGSDTNNAATPATPKRNLSALLNRYSLEPGDVVYVDTGLYTNNTTIVIDQLDRGFRLVGSTNNVAGGTVFAFTNTAIGLSLFQAPTTTVENIRFQGANTAIEVRQSPDVVMRGLQIYDSSVGVLMRDSPRVRIENSLLRNLETAVDMRLCQQVQMVNNVFWSNTASAVFISEASASMINSVIGVLGSNRFGYNLRFNSSLTADYNLYFLTNGGAVATEVVTNAPFMIWENVTAWRRDTGRDLNSLATDPLFANPLSGDFHPRSAGGRFNPATGLFVTDAETSPLIDAGFPVSDFSRETSPNGGRINIGMYGNTPEASRTPAAARLRVASLNDGGRVRGDNVPLTWRAYGAATGHTVRLEYSINNGAAWSVIQSNVAANSEIFFWNTGTSATWFARWRVISENNPAVSDQSAKPFQLGNAALSLYVNDTFTNNLVYTTAPGNDGNLGISPSAPRLTIQSVINDYDLEPGDTVYVDTGEYIIASPIRIGRFDAWNTMSNLLPLAAGGVSIRIQGSTNELAGGSRIIGTLGINVFELNEAYGVHLRDLQISHFPVASGGSIQAIASRFGLFEWLRMRDGQNGISLNNSSQARIRHVVASGFTDHGIVARNFSVAVDVQQSILWSNRIGVYVTEQAQLNIRNSVLAALGMDTVGLRRNDGPLPQAVGTLLSDYNLFWAAPLAFVAELQGNQYPGARLRFQRLVNWTRTTGLDINSLAADPQFANASQGDWHPRSPYGRFIAGVGYVTNASEAFSPLIDLGDPTLSFAQEPAPNGNRVNAGLYGNTSQASLSPTSGVLQVLTFNDGGSGAGDIELRWNVAGPASSHLLTLDFSNDGGVTWTNITSNVVALTKSYAWDSVPYGAAAAGLWRVVSQNNPALAATNQNFFALRQGGSIPYYVNGPSVDQAVFCTAPGNDDNNGFLPSSPKATLQSLLDAVDLEPGDVVYVDTGVYAQNAAINIGEFDSGVATNPVVIRGSTNVVAGGTIFDRITGLGNGILIDRAEGILLRDITVRNAAVGVFLELCNDIALQNVTLRNNTFAGVRVAGTRGTLIRNSLFFNNPTNAVLVGLFGQGSFATPGNVDIINNTFWGNRYSVHVAQGGSATAYNNLIQANGPDSRIYFMGLGVTNVIADYNAYFRQSSALMGERERLVGGNDFYTRLIDWQRDRGNDLHSLSHNPLVANAAGGDFHLLSANGRTLPNGSVVFDPPGTFSPLIDAGQPAAAWTNEPAPNGGRVNIGRYGNTAEASRSRTNGWLLALSLNDGGRIFGTNIVRWTAGGWPTSSLVRFEYANNGVDYSIIASNIPVYLDGFTWNVSSEPVTQLARWRVISEDDSNTVSVAGPFTIKNNPLVAYVNNDSIVNNVYTVAPGNETNDGLSPATPLNDPATAIERFPLSEGDIIYIDTGTYVITNAVGMRIGLFGEEIKAGQPGDPIRIIGSTNRAAGGTTIIGHPDTQFGLRISNTKHISIEHLNFSGNTNGVSMVGVEDVRFRWVNVSSNITGFNMNNAGGASFRHCSAWNNTVGLFLDGTFSSVSWDYGVFWSNRIAGIRHTYGFMSVSNSILGAPSSNSILIEVNSGFATIRGNYNLYYPGPNLNLFRDTLGNVFFRTLRGWQNARGIDANSLVVDPLFADPGLGNFHLRSDQGRFNPTSGTFVLDADTSWGIDAGAPSDPFNLETQPNGDRVNVGVFGNTPLASRSTTNPALFVGSLRDGGTAGNPQLLTWLTRGLVSNATVRLEYTPNDGLVWETVATNVPAINGQYVWNNGALDSTPLARWRIILESNPVVSDITEAVFTLRNGPIAYYVNDSNTLGNVYTTVPGSPLNNGITVSTPVHSVSTIIDRFELIGGDVVYVDTGYYPITENIVIRADDAGNEDARVHIQGSTNRLAGGTVIHRSSTNAWSNNPENDEAVFELVNARYIELSDMIVQNANAGVFVNNPFPRNDWNLFRNLEIRDGGFYGIRLNGSSENTLERVVIHRMVGIGIDIFRGSSNRVVSSVIWSNQNGGIYTMLSETMITNSVLHAFGQVTNSALILSESTVSADYNNYFIQGSASYALVDGEPITGLPQWYFRTTQDVHSISVEPLFHDPANSDFHPRSISGRFNPATQSFVFTDTDTSWLIDTGDPLSGVGNESAPNGGRRNIGLFGGTAQASRSRTEPWVLAITAMAGGRPGGIFPLHWAYGNIDPTNRVNLDYSVDSGTNWNVIATDVPINLDGFLWNSLNADPFQSPTTKWRVQVVGATNVVDETDRTFGLNAPFRFFINNTSTVGNVFTTAPGDDNNLGISSNFPKASLRSLLDFWDLDPEDSIYIDTGVYLLTTNDINTEARLNQAGSAQHPVSVIGSPNGVLWDGSALKIGPFIRTVLIIGAPYMVWENISVRSGLIEGRGTNIILRNWSVNDGSIQLSGAQGTVESFYLTNALIEVVGRDIRVEAGYVINGSLRLAGTDAYLGNTVVAGEVSPLVTIEGTNVTVVNNTLVANRTAIRQLGGDSRSTLRNNIIIANGAPGTAFAIERQAGVVFSDYNLFFLRNGAWFGGAQDGLWERLLYWQERSGQDTNSLVADPLFANEAGGDYRLRSVTGRWQGGGWVVDGVHSPAIDAGAPFDSFSRESAPNGGRINIGAFGNTEQASRSRTTPWVYAITMNDGGVLRGTNTLRWLAGAMDPTNRVILQYSANAGTNWTTIVAGLPALNGAYSWDTTTASNTLDARWRVVLEGDPSVVDVNDSIFNIRNDVRGFYVNNASTNGNVFTTAAGNNANDGRTPATPKATLENLLATYDTEPADTIYVDTGIYTSSVIQVIWSRGGDSNANMIIRGSTNVAAGGTVLRRPTRSGDAMLLNASYVTVRDMIFENANRGLYILTNRFVVVDQVEARSNNLGIAILGGGNHRITSSRVWNNTLEGGIQVWDSQNVRVENVTFVNNLPYSIQYNVVPNSFIQNNIFYHDVATSNQQFALSGPTGTVLTTFIDYNVYWFGPLSKSNAFIYGSFTNLLPWQRAQVKDMRSAITNPMFHNVTSGVFTLQSQAGRYDFNTRTFVSDTNTSWAIDKGNPFTVFEREPAPSGNRVNVGAYGNTLYASKGSTGDIVFARTGNEFLPITEAENAYPLIWHVLNLPYDLTFTVQYSGDGGVVWVPLQSGVSAYQEYIFWTNSPTFNSFNAKWRIVGEGAGNTNYWDINDGQIRTFFGVHRISQLNTLPNQQSRFVWRGAWNEDYQIQYATNYPFGTNRVHNWQNLVAVTNLKVGGDTPFIDVESTNDRFRVYRVIWLGTNGVPFQ
ncbi:MAG TPA: right-handed parallel beta-helix repeat-containing protein [Kiritimatiellia bacterium]|nr:right-handed parallel beta-helix repeat-containing protein [Kiritimatiellia bacterium]